MSDTTTRLIWNELGDAKAREIYISKLIGKKRKTLKCITVFTLIFSTSGVFGWKLFEPYPIIVCAGLAGMSIFSLIQPHLFPSEKELDSYNKLSSFYCEYFIKLERLWIDLDTDKIDSESAREEFYKIKQTEQSINALADEIHLGTNKKLATKASQESNEYLNRIHTHE